MIKIKIEKICMTEFFMVGFSSIFTLNLVIMKIKYNEPIIQLRERELKVYIFEIFYYQTDLIITIFNNYEIIL